MANEHALIAFGDTCAQIEMVSIFYRDFIEWNSVRSTLLSMRSTYELIEVGNFVTAVSIRLQHRLL